MSKNSVSSASSTHVAPAGPNRSELRNQLAMLRIANYRSNLDKKDPKFIAPKADIKDASFVAPKCDELDPTFVAPKSDISDDMLESLIAAEMAKLAI